MSEFTRVSRIKPQISPNRRLSFYASIFGEIAPITERDASGKLVSYREVIAPGAFTDALSSTAEVIANIDHDPAQTFARRSSGELLLQEDPHGLFASCYLPPGEFGDSIIRRVESGELDGCSFRFGAVKDRTNGDLVERLSVTLADVCICRNAVAAYHETEVHLRQNLELKKLFSRMRMVKIKQRILDSNNKRGIVES
ncbi:Phage prohead protease, HK97 family protein OS=Pseudoxanthomonas spadix (strain BD-a59) GN=DSC_11420 PE=4 SV=1: Peptidase_U35 [Gemmata massiliana]|uniref:Prohead serine protease domain-containing protein n=1 Tax=Gemmata massiliana TaxID=1210884 RepID=A0A6P2D3W0_9BACT|nr:HK97 family phage prohead protease [Gemmata massiliana]VTR94080.1 Phage prohead protease, HK97 family protein OS=Pseudoxanthomonas spadix (strain BD-a59) GN=DSC_11420 PE=4 SV=1: Peptidase_U35 [Gemmata massiliana]